MRFSVGGSCRCPAGGLGLCMGEIACAVCLCRAGNTVFPPPEALALAGRVMAPPSAAWVRLRFGVDGRRLDEWRAQGLVRSLPGRARGGAFCWFYHEGDLGRLCRGR